MINESGLRVTFDDIRAADERLDNPRVVKQTPIDRSTSLEQTTGAESVVLKLEHLQWTGSFKTRGAYNKISTLPDQQEVSGVVAASAGNHAQGVAFAATTLGVDSTIVMPKTAPQAKIEATREYGAEVELVGQDFRAAQQHAQSLVSDSDVYLIHAYDDPEIIAGQGTLGVEMHDNCPTADTIIVPIGGGGLISGISIAFDALSPETRIVGVQAEGAATVPDSLNKGAPVTADSVDTIADGIATGGISDLTLSAIQEHVDEVVTVSDDQISEAVLLLMERAKQVVEGAGAASVAALQSDELDVSGETVMPLLCGGNLDMTMLRTVLIHTLSRRRQLLRLRVHIEDQPGTMAELSDVIGHNDANIQTVRHDRAVDGLDVGEAYLVFQIETSGADHAAGIVESIEQCGYDVEVTTTNSQA